MLINIILVVYIGTFLKPFFSTPIRFDGEWLVSIALTLINVGLFYFVTSLAKRAKGQGSRVKGQGQKYYWNVIMGLAFVWHIVTFIRIESGVAAEFEGFTYLMLPPFLFVAIGIASLFPSNNN